MPYTLPVDTHMADFRVLTPEQIKHIKPVDPSTHTFMMHQHIENTDLYLNQLMKTNQSSDEQETYWFPTPEQPGDLTTYTPIQQRIFDELIELKQLEQLNQTTAKNQEKNSSTISTGPTPLSAHSKNNTLNTSFYNITLSLPDIVLILVLIKNLRLN